MPVMTKFNITSFLQLEGSNIGNLLIKLKRLREWNAKLRDILPLETPLLEHCRIVGMDKTSLIVIADNPHWVTRFRFFIPQLVEKFAKIDEFKHIRAICCKVRPAHQARGSFHKNKRRPLRITTETAEVLHETALKVKDPRLKKILEKIASRAIDDES
jgi:hypothetical protein